MMFCVNLVKEKITTQTFMTGVVYVAKKYIIVTYIRYIKKALLKIDFQKSLHSD